MTKMWAVGIISRKTASAARHSSGVMALTSAMGVPGRGLRKLTGTQWMPSSRMVSANSTRCSGVWPMPRMPPEQTWKPRSRAARMVSSCSS